MKLFRGVVYFACIHTFHCPPLRVTISKSSVSQHQSLITPNSTHVCCSPWQTHLIQLIEGLMIEVESGVHVQGYNKNVDCWGLGNTGLLRGVIKGQVMIQALSQMEPSCLYNVLHVTRAYKVTFGTETESLLTFFWLSIIDLFGPIMRPIDQHVPSYMYS